MMCTCMYTRHIHIGLSTLFFTIAFIANKIVQLCNIKIRDVKISNIIFYIRFHNVVFHRNVDVLHPRLSIRCRDVSFVVAGRSEISRPHLPSHLPKHLLWLVARSMKTLEEMTLPNGRNICMSSPSPNSWGRW